MPQDDDDFQLYPILNGFPSESLEDYTFEVKALVARSMDDDKAAHWTTTGSSAWRSSWKFGLSKPERHKLIVMFLVKKGTRKMLWTML